MMSLRGAHDAWPGLLFALVFLNAQARTSNAPGPFKRHLCQNEHKYGRSHAWPEGECHALLIRPARVAPDLHLQVNNRTDIRLSLKCERKACSSFNVSGEDLLLCASWVWAGTSQASGDGVPRRRLAPASASRARRPFPTASAASDSRQSNSRPHAAIPPSRAAARRGAAPACAA